MQVANRIYATVFDARWVKEQWPEHWIRRVPSTVIGLVAALFVTVILLGLLLFQIQRTRLSARLNARLTAQVGVSDSLRQVTEAVNTRLSEQVRVSDSLRTVEATVNVRLSDQIQVSDSLRGIAEERLDEARAARLETMTIALASKAVRELKLGDAELGALLARQAFLLSQVGEGEFLDPIYDALVQTLNALDDMEAVVRGGPRILAGQRAGVHAVAYSPDGRWVASASEDGAVGLWEREDARSFRLLQGHTDDVRSLAFSPDGARLASAGDDHLVQVWSRLDQEQPDREQVGRHQGGVWTVAFSPDGRRLASAGADHAIQVWDLRGQDTPVALRVFARIRALAFGPKGELLFFGSEDGTIKRWAWRRTTNQVDAWEGQQGRLYTLAFSPKGDLLASGGDEPQVRLWRVNTPDMTLEPGPVLRGHEGPIYAVAFSLDGTRLASGSADHSVQVWDVEQVHRSPILLQDHTAWVRSRGLQPGRHPAGLGQRRPERADLERSA